MQLYSLRSLAMGRNKFKFCMRQVKINCSDESTHIWTVDYGKEGTQPTIKEMTIEKNVEEPFKWWDVDFTSVPGFYGDFDDQAVYDIEDQFMDATDKSINSPF